jgi:hypothetical protein
VYVTDHGSDDAIATQQQVASQQQHGEEASAVAAAVGMQQPDPAQTAQPEHGIDQSEEAIIYIQGRESHLVRKPSGNSTKADVLH